MPQCRSPPPLLAGRHRPLAFLAATVPLRLVRYLSIVIIVAGLDIAARSRLGRPARITMLCGIWTLFYAIFWSTFPQ